MRHHIGLLAGTALITGAGGTVLFAIVGVAASVPFLLRLRRRFHSWWAPAIGFAVFAAMFAVSTLVIGPAINSGPSQPTGPAQSVSRPHRSPPVTARPSRSRAQAVEGDGDSRRAAVSVPYPAVAARAVRYAIVGWPPAATPQPIDGTPRVTITGMATSPTRLRAAAAAAALAAALGGCASSRPASDGHDAPSAAGGALPSRHVHAVARNPADGRVLLATHDGLFRLGSGTAPARIGPVIDLMGFTIVGPNHFYASGHPGPGTDLPNPVGLIESTDGGHTWTPLSRHGRSDFHALSASAAGVVGYDGDELVASTDGRTWHTLTPPVTPHAVAASPDGATLLITSEAGLARSTDRGRTWIRITTPVPLHLLAFADARHVTAATPDGRVATSRDAGATWQTRGSVGAAPHALTAQSTGTGARSAREILAVTTTGMLRSTDDGATFTPYQP